jgi:hypothetical protein
MVAGKQQETCWQLPEHGAVGSWRHTRWHGHLRVQPMKATVACNGFIIRATLLIDQGHTAYRK